VKLDAPTLGSLLGGLAGDDATMKGLVELVGSALAGDDSEDEDRAQRRRRAARRLRRMQRGMRRLAERNARAAEALGACECWAEDPGCRRCQGMGLPGYYEPDRPAFDALVAPLLRSRSELVQTYLDPGDPSTRPAE
jgi:hypothetical protein